MKRNDQPNIHFNNLDSEWKQWKIGDILTEKYRPILIEDEKEYQLITVKRRNEGIVSRGHLKGKDILVKNYFEVEEGDYVISKRQIIHGACGIVPRNLHKSVVSNEYLVAISNKHITTEFWSLISKLPVMYRQFFLSSFGVDIEKMVFDVRDWKKRSIVIPKRNEQKRIVEYFDHFDNLIQFYQNKHKKLIDLKKSMLAKIFPIDGESVPEIRFKQFSKKWMPIKFKTIATVRRGLTYSPNNLAKSGIRVLRSSNIYEDHFRLREDDVFVNADSVNIDLVKENDILITSANGSSKLVGKHAVIENLKDRTAHGGFMLLATTKFPFFVNASMSTLWYNKFINIYTAGGGGSIGNLSKSDLEEQEILIPDEDEQKIIGDYFKNIDNLILTYKSYLIKLKQIKSACYDKMISIAP